MLPVENETFKRVNHNIIKLLLKVSSKLRVRTNFLKFGKGNFLSILIRGSAAKAGKLFSPCEWLGTDIMVINCFGGLAGFEKSNNQFKYYLQYIFHVVPS